MSNKSAFLLLSDGTLFRGESLGSSGEAVGEVVFNTAMTGYQEIITDPSYRKQIVCMTFTQIGNCGVNDEDIESSTPWMSGLIVKDASRRPSNWRMTTPLDAYLRKHGIVGISGIDTRVLTRHIRRKGAINGVISTEDDDLERLFWRVSNVPSMRGSDLVGEVTSSSVYHWDQGLWNIDGGASDIKTRNNTGPQRRVVVYDFGVKMNILRTLVSRGLKVTVVPASTSVSDILRMKPDGVVLSNGPGDPEPLKYAVRNVKELVGKLPILAICLGHQILAMSLGARTFKLKFGHHGSNQPVLDIERGKVSVTSQNHGFAVDRESLRQFAELTHLNLNDRTVEGFRHRKYSLLSIQYHPEASPGPHDSSDIFDQFFDMISCS